MALTSCRRLGDNSPGIGTADLCGAVVLVQGRCWRWKGTGLHFTLLRISVCLGCQTVWGQLWEVVINQHTLALGTGDDNQVGLKLFFTVVFFFLPPGTAAEPQPCFSWWEDQGIRSSKGLRALPQTQTLLNGMAMFSSSSSSDTTALNLVFKAYWDVSWLHQTCTGWKGPSHWSIGGHGSGVGNVLQAAHEVPGRCSHKPTACLVES